MRIQIILLTLAALSFSALAAEVTGTWKAEFGTQRGLQKYTSTLKQDGASVTSKASAELNGETREADLKEGKVEGDTVSFVEPLSNKDGLIRISQGVHAYLKEKNVPHIWHVDEHTHDFQHWKKALYQFSQLIFKPTSSEHH